MLWNLLLKYLFSTGLTVLLSVVLVPFWEFCIVGGILKLIRTHYLQSLNTKHFIFITITYFDIKL